jgi:hypothetical protein
MDIERWLLGWRRVVYEELGRRLIFDFVYLRHASSTLRGSHRIVTIFFISFKHNKPQIRAVQCQCCLDCHGCCRVLEVASWVTQVSHSKAPCVAAHQAVQGSTAGCSPSRRTKPFVHFVCVSRGEVTSSQRSMRGSAYSCWSGMW